MRIRFHASREHFSPRNLLNLVQLAEQSAFEAILSSDHTTLWSESQNNSGFAWKHKYPCMCAAASETFMYVSKGRAIASLLMPVELGIEPNINCRQVIRAVRQQ